MLFQTLSEHKVFRDTIHSYVHVDHVVIWKLIQTKEMQRLKRIHQLGGTLQVFPTAEHSRFSHSLGTYEIARMIIETVSGVQEALNELEQMTLLCAALLHDVGHGPFSHAFEMMHPVHHEEYSIAIIQNEQSEVNQVLREAHNDLPELVASVISKTHPNRLLIQLVSSQIDADRMDYLLRDAYFTGTPYGSFDVNRVLRMAQVYQGKLVFKESGMAAIENFVMGRYHMYRQVYFHPASMSFEVVLAKLLKRFTDLVQTQYSFHHAYPYLVPFTSGQQVSVLEYHQLDESVLYCYAKQMMEEEDPILSDLANRFLNRHLFQHKSIEQEGEIQTIKDKVGTNLPLDYYFFMDKPTQVVYKKYGRNDLDAIYILMRSGRVEEISKVSVIVKALASDRVASKGDTLVFYPDLRK